MDWLYHLIGKVVVWLHYKRKIDVYMLCQIHEPELWAKANRKAKIPTSVRWEVWRRDGLICVYCGVWAHNLTLDHKIPEKFGGSSEEDNLLTACSSCNQRKGSMTYDEFIKSKWLKKKRKLAKNSQPTLITSQAVTTSMLKDGTLTTSKIIGESLSLKNEK